MARILIAGDARWYDELRAIAYYGESEMESWILQHAKSLFPYHFVLPFKTDIPSMSTGDRRRPDLALIRRDFSDWAVVEIELERHPLGHVVEQTRVFAEGAYNTPEIAEYAQH